MRNLYPFLIVIFFAIFSIPTSLWGQNESEPNNTFTEADAINFEQPVSGAILTIGDQDYYSVQVPGPGVVVARLRNIPTGRNYGVTFYNASQQELTSDFGSATNPAYADQLRCSAGIIYIRVSESGNNAASPDQYELEVSFNEDDVYECNNSFEEAAPITFGQSINASIFDIGDQDYYRVQVPGPGVVVARLRNIPTGRNYGVTFYNASQQELTSDFGSATNPAYADQLRCSAGIIYIRVNESGNNAASPDQYELG